jgi:hypothetical protein
VCGLELTCCWFLTSATAFCLRQSISIGSVASSRLPWEKPFSLFSGVRWNLR